MGEAKAANERLALTNMDILDQRCGRKQVIVNHHMDALIKIPQINNMS